MTKRRMLSIILCVVMLMSLLPITGSVYAADEIELTVDNYDVKITNAAVISHIRYASGEHTTASSIKNAEDCVNISATVVANNTVDGVYVRNMPDGGYYTFWVKTTTGNEYIIPADLTYMEQEVTSDGVMITVHNLYGVKDFFIAEGDYDTYSDIKANYLFNCTSKKFGTAHDYTYTVKNPGIHTVCIRYTDSTRENLILKVDLTVTEPVFTENGLQLIVSNLDGVKVVRTAYGDYSTPGEIKRAEGSRGFSAKTLQKNGDSFTIQYRENGEVSVAVVYKNGYEVMYKYNVEKKVPAVVQNANIISFTGLDDLKVIRYAEGEYTTSNQIKNAAGSKVITASEVSNDLVQVTLELGTYTFCVQYNDDSYNYYTVVVDSMDPVIPDEPDEPVITEPSFVVESVEAVAGETVDVVVKVVNNPGIASIGMHVSFDEALTLNSITPNTEIGGNFFPAQTMESPAKLVWVRPDADVEGDWSFVTLSFTVSEDAAAGTYPISVSYNAEDVYNIEENNVYFDTVNGNITVK